MNLRHIARSAPGKIALFGLSVILTATLFPYSFSTQNFISLSHSFGLSNTIARRGNDLLIGVDGRFGQPFKGEVDEIQIYSRKLSAAEIARLAMMNTPAEAPALWYKFDEGAGMLAADNSGNGNDGVLFNGPRWTRGKSGTALCFFRPDQYIRVRNNPSIDISGKEITIALWVFLLDSTDDVDQVIIAKPWKADSMDEPYYQYAVEFDSHGDKTLDFYFADASGRLRGRFSTKPRLGTWIHAAFTYDGNRVRGYIDGAERLSMSIAEPWHPGDIAVNLLLFVPFGFGLAGLMRNLGFSAITTVLLAFAVGFALSLTVETLQCFLPGRDPSFVDVATNSISSMAGAWCLLLFAGETLNSRAERFELLQSGRS
jgi:VanZ family protein